MAWPADNLYHALFHLSAPNALLAFVRDGSLVQVSQTSLIIAQFALYCKYFLHFPKDFPNIFDIQKNLRPINLFLTLSDGSLERLLCFAAALHLADGHLIGHPLLTFCFAELFRVFPALDTSPDTHPGTHLNCLLYTSIGLLTLKDF